VRTAFYTVCFCINISIDWSRKSFFSGIFWPKSMWIPWWVGRLYIQLSKQRWYPRQRAISTLRNNNAHDTKSVDSINIQETNPFKTQILNSGSRHELWPQEPPVWSWIPIIFQVSLFHVFKNVTLFEKNKTGRNAGIIHKIYPKCSFYGIMV
jgi:hypothetical protein